MQVALAHEAPARIERRDSIAHEGRFEFVARNTIVNTAVAMTAFVIVGVLVNLIFIAFAFHRVGVI